MSFECTKRYEERLESLKAENQNTKEEESNPENNK